MRNTVSIVFFSILTMNVSNAQLPVGPMVVNDVQGNALKRVGLQVQAAEKSISAASKVVLTAMSGDITGSFEALVDQNEILKNADELRSTLGNTVVAMKAYETFDRNLNVAERSFIGLSDKIEDIGDKTAFNQETIYDINSGMRRVRKSLERSNDLFIAAIDLEDKMERATRIKLINDAAEETDLAILEIERIKAVIELHEFNVEQREMVLLAQLPPSAKTIAEKQEQINKSQEVYLTDASRELSEIFASANDNTDWHRIAIIFFKVGDWIIVFGSLSIAAGLWARQGPNVMLNSLLPLFYTAGMYMFLQLVILNIL